jgi:hypothetical protein
MTPTPMPSLSRLRQQSALTCGLGPTSMSARLMRAEVPRV